MPKAGRSLVVVVADPDAKARQQIADVLASELGATVIGVESGREVLEQLRSNPRVDLVVAELQLADTSGTALCRRLRRDVALRELPFIVVSASDDEDVLAAVFEAGAHELIRKPVRPVELAVRARAALRDAHLRARTASRIDRLTEEANKLRETAEELSRLVCVDPLCGVANRRHIEGLLRAAWQQGVRSGRGLALLVLDLDGFHLYNERHGHIAGDACLKQVAKTVALGLRRAGDLVGRWGGEEFLVLLPDTDLDGACVVAERIRAAVEALAIPHGAPGMGDVVTVSIGIAATVPRMHRDAELLLAEADGAMYRAKAAGRNRVAGGGDPGKRAPGPAGVRWPEPVVLDPSLAETIPGLLDAHVQDLTLVEVAAARRDFHRARFVARQMRGLASTHGFQTGDLGRQLEQVAHAEDTVEVRRVVEELRWYLAHVPVVYRRRSGQAGG